MILVVDNYDSFTYNLVHYLAELGAETVVVRNDDLTADDAWALKPEAVLLSPGPCAPDQAGICLPLIDSAPLDMPILGVCLGHQSIGAAMGGRIIRAQEQMHGKTSIITTDEQGVYAGLPKQFTVIRYHSLAIERESLPDCLAITSWTDDGEIMGVRHTGPQTDPHFAPLEGVQFHPESILSQHGHALLSNFLKM